MTNPLRFSHISDLHFPKFSFLRFLNFFSKRWLVMLSLILQKNNHSPKPLLNSLPEIFKKKNIRHVLISGDISSTSLVQEFQMATNFINKLQSYGVKTYAIPGNHDKYTKKDNSKNTFYKYFKSQYSKDLTFDNYNLIDHKITTHPLNDKWILIGLDTSITTGLLSSQGNFSEKIEKHLIEALKNIPKTKNIIILNHFPFFKNVDPCRDLIRKSNFKKIFESFKNIKLFLHGHTHNHSIADLRHIGLPIIVDSGSTTNINNGFFNIIEITNESCSIEVYRWNKKWSLNKKYNFIW